MKFLTYIYVYISSVLVFIKRKFISKKYKIIPIGVYCLPRSVTTFNKLKLTKEQGELTCPFDLAFFYDIDVIIRLIDTNFQNFYQNLEYDNNNHYWVNKSINAVFNHDGLLKREEFIEKYDKRIENFYNYVNDKSFEKIFLFADFIQIKQIQIDRLVEVLKKITKDEKFKVVIINQSNKKMSAVQKNVYIINQNHNCKNFDKINLGGNWITELRKRKSIESQKISNDITLKIINILLK